MTKHIRIATRQSPLALWQAEFIKKQLQDLHPDLSVELIGLTTKGDQILNVTLSKVGGKGLFVKELERAMLNDEADIAVHSMKDVPSEFPDGLCLPVICERADPADAFVSQYHESLMALPEGSVVGTSSLRRESQLRHARPDLNIQPLRGNVNTRLAKLDAGEYDAICLAAIGLTRLEFSDRIRERFESSLCLPAVGQGALGIECRADDSAIMELIAPLKHVPSWQCVMAERQMNHLLGGSCQIPIAAFASIENGQMSIEGMVGRPDGKHIIRHTASGHADDYSALGSEIATALNEKGAGAILESLRG